MRDRWARCRGPFALRRKTRPECTRPRGLPRTLNGMFSFGFSLIIAGLIGTMLFLYIRNRKVSAPRLPGNDGGNLGYTGGEEYREPSPEYQYFESRRNEFLDRLYSRTSSPEIPVTLTLRDWVDQGFYVEGGNYWAAAQQFTYYLIDGGYVRAYDTEGDELTAQRVLTDRPAALQLTPSEYQRRSNRAA